MQFPPEEEGGHCGAEEVDVEHVTHVQTVVVDAQRVDSCLREYHEVGQVQEYVESDEEQFKGGEFQRLFLVAEVGEGDALEGKIN